MTYIREENKGSMSLPGDIYAVQAEVIRLHEKLELLKESKREHEHRLQKTTMIIRTKGRMPDQEYKSLCKRQLHAKEKIHEIEKQMRPIKHEIRTWAAIEDELKAKERAAYTAVVCEKGKPSLIDGLVSLQKKYLAFAEDNTRINSMRLMASQIANELTELISGEQA